MKISKLITRKAGWAVSNALIVEAEIEGDKDDLLERLCQSVTSWVKYTSAGNQAWECSGGDFNIGDLASYLDDPDFLRYVMFEGIRGFVISSVPEEAFHWPYDAVLVNVADLEEV